MKNVFNCAYDYYLSYELIKIIKEFEIVTVVHVKWDTASN